MRISVVIPAYNAESSLPDCLRAIAGQRGLAGSLDVLVVDDGSTDGTARVAEVGSARVVRQPNRGPAAARNAGVRSAFGDLVLMTDSDCVPAPDWAAELTRALTAADAAVGQSINTGKGLFSAVRRSHARPEGAEGAVALNTSNFGVRRDIALSMPFDEAIGYYGEDTDLGWRMRREGLRFVHAPRATVLHDHRFDARGFLRHGFLHGRGSARLHYKHRRIPRDLVPFGLAIIASLAAPVVTGGPLLGLGAWALPLAALVHHELRVRRKPLLPALGVLPLQLAWYLAKGAGFALQALRLLAGAEPALRESRRNLTGRGRQLALRKGA